MLSWLSRMDAKTAWFYFQVLLYALLILGSTFFVYGRLDYVRSYLRSAPSPSETSRF